MKYVHIQILHEWKQMQRSYKKKSASALLYYYHGLYDSLFIISKTRENAQKTNNFYSYLHRKHRWRYRYDLGILICAYAANKVYETFVR